MSNLDNRDGIQALDPGGMYTAIARFPDQVRTAVTIGERVAFDSSRYEGFTSIVVCGMGGSAIGGDLARSLLSDRLMYPMYICRNYQLPAFAGPDTLVIASSYSGNTEETLSAVDQALTRKCRLFALSTGGTLGEICRRHQIPLAVLPTGLQPRAALGYSFVPLMLFFRRMDLSGYAADDFLALADFLETRMAGLAVETPSDNNPAKQLAMQLYGRLPIIYSGPELTDAVATRFKGQICENAKMLAFANQFPEFNHNELVGWKLIDALQDFLRVIVLRDIDDNPRVAARMNIVTRIITDKTVKVKEIHAEGANRLQRMMSLIQFGDFSSFYLAVLNKVDPTPVEAIERLKDELAKMP